MHLVHVSASPHSYIYSSSTSYYVCLHIFYTISMKLLVLSLVFLMLILLLIFLPWSMLHLFLIFNLSLSTDTLPSDWKKSYVILFLNLNLPSHFLLLNNYHYPMSLLSLTSKVFNVTFFDNLYDFISIIIYSLIINSVYALDILLKLPYFSIDHLPGL